MAVQGKALALCH